MSMPNPNDPPVRVAVVGGGAAGLLAAAVCGEHGADVTLYEKNEKVGRKLAITGKGRCNLTNDCPPAEFLQNVVSNPRFLYSAVNRFSPADTKALFERLGVPLKVERGRRVFPQSDRAYDIVDALWKYAGRNASLRHETVTGLTFSDGAVTGIVTSRGSERFDRVLLCTGGASYPLTGSDGDGYRFARDAGHTVTPLSPSLVPLTSSDAVCPSLMGLSLKNVGLKILVRATGKCLYEDFGEMLFTHFGLSGPMILSASSHMHEIAVRECDAVIDMKPALDEKTLDERILSDFSKEKNRCFGNSLGALLPAKMAAVMPERTDIPKEKKVNEITREERRRLNHEIKQFRVPLSGARPISEAIITRGGVDVRQIDPRTMASKRCRGLYFCGELIDCDAYTGGYNLQIAFSTAYAAAIAAAGDNGDQYDK